jgi:two-component system, NarL family, response regulator NreC
MKTTIVIADDHELLSTGVEALLRGIPDFEVIGTCNNGRDLVAMVERLRPEVAIVDLAMPGMNGVEVARRLRDVSRSTRVIILTGYTDDSYVQEALEAGVVGYIVKSGATSDLIGAIRKGTPRNVYLSTEVAAILNLSSSSGYGRRSTDRMGRLTLSPREREVLQLIVEGNPNKQIAAVLGISEATAKDHRKHIKEKLGIRDIAGLTRYAIRIGMIRADLRESLELDRRRISARE